MLARKHYPRRLTINGLRWKIRFVAEIWTNNPREVIWGCCYPDSREIHIRRDLEPEDMLHTVVHEVMHALEVSYRFRIPHKLIEKLERPIAELLQHNVLEMLFPDAG